ncbi:MAG: DNA mismatch repair endonuclease MutL [Candidatus Omnitrophica bacterium]|nr:DNA mismatch repair endonuclease MutL [Candidatus Omnitrophota bacterium]
MSKVHTLPPHVISKIAAGEVIERPASVVKEILENALDARACAVEIKIKSAGKKLIYLKDDGDGIDPDDIEKIFLRHSTSKISCIDDLYAIHSLGFRGEALYSIAAIADVTLRSKTAGADTGVEIHLRGGQPLTVKPVAMSQGTEIEIQELFFNTPARRKFLKGDTTELNHILSVVTPYTLLLPEVSFRLTHGARTLLNLPVSKNRANRVSEVLRLDGDRLIECRSDNADFKENFTVYALLGDMNIQRTRRDLQFVYINGRPVYNRNLNFHLNRMYRVLMPQGVFPFFLIDIKIPGENVDVNIHPAKREVKIKDEYNIISYITAFCQDALKKNTRLKQMPLSVQETNEKPAAQKNIGEFPDDVSPPPPALHQYLLKETNDVFPAVTEKRAHEVTGGPSHPEKLKEAMRSSRYLGSFLRKYLLFESNASLIVCDQHAAQERVIYEQLVRQIRSGSLEVQHLLSPLLVKLTVSEMLIWEESKENIEQLGFLTTQWDSETIALHGYPQLIHYPQRALRNLLSEDAAGDNSLDFLARRACRESLKTGYEMVPDQAEYLRRQLLGCEDAFTCPHGRPILIEIQDKEFERYFLRR